MEREARGSPRQLGPLRREVGSAPRGRALGHRGGGLRAARGCCPCSVAVVGGLPRRRLECHVRAEHLHQALITVGADPVFTQYAIKTYDVDGEYYSKFYDMSRDSDSESEDEGDDSD